MLDLNKDGQLGKEELGVIISSFTVVFRQLLLPSEGLHSFVDDCFTKFDKDNKGYLTYDEYADAGNIKNKTNRNKPKQKICINISPLL